MVGRRRGEKLPKILQMRRWGCVPHRFLENCEKLAKTEMVRRWGCVPHRIAKKVETCKKYRQAEMVRRWGCVPHRIVKIVKNCQKYHKWGGGGACHTGPWLWKCWKNAKILTQTQDSGKLWKMCKIIPQWGGGVRATQDFGKEGKLPKMYTMRR